MVVDVTDLDLPALPNVGNRARYEQAARQVEGWTAHWLARTELGYVVWRYEDVQAVVRDRRWHNAAGVLVEALRESDPRLAERPARNNILTSEGAIHGRLRRLVGPAFSVRSADRLRPFMRELVNELVDPIAAAGGGDLVAGVTEPYPIPVICELLGAPKEDWQLFSRLAADVLEVFSFDVADKLDTVLAAQDELDAYARGLIEHRRTRPADDLITDLIAAEEAGDRLSTEECVQMVEAVIVGGTDTTRNQLGNAIAVFAAHPEQWALLGERPELAGRAVDEVMRFMGAVRGVARIASEDIVYRGVRFPAGTVLAAGLLEANRDVAVFDDPHRFDITRPDPVPLHLGFGGGAHACLGQALARAELQEALPILARRLPGLRVAGEITWRPDGVAIFGPAHLPVTCEPGH